VITLPRLGLSLRPADPNAACQLACAQIIKSCNCCSPSHTLSLSCLRACSQRRRLKLATLSLAPPRPSVTQYHHQHRPASGVLSHSSICPHGAALIFLEKAPPEVSSKRARLHTNDQISRRARPLFLALLHCPALSTARNPISRISLYPPTPTRWRLCNASAHD
jgi:hypothetical protein